MSAAETLPTPEPVVAEVIVILERQRLRGDTWSPTLNPTDGAGWVRHPSMSPCPERDKLAAFAGSEWSADWIVDRSDSKSKTCDIRSAATVDKHGWRYADSFDNFDRNVLAPAQSAAVRQRRWRRTQSPLSKKAQQRPMNHLRMSLLQQQPRSQQRTGSFSGPPASPAGVSNNTVPSSDDDAEVENMDVSMYFSTIDRGAPTIDQGVMALSRSTSSTDVAGGAESAPGPPTPPPGSIDGGPNALPGLADAVYQRLLSTEEALWFEGAQRAGMWLVNQWGGLLCAFTRGRGIAIRWKPDAIGDRVRVADLACSGDGHAWVVTTDGDLYASTNYKELEEENIDTVVVTAYENQRWWVSPRGWSVNMLPSDRSPWSDETGLTAQPLESFALPSVRWMWMNNWEPMTGPHTDREGWQYAKDFTKAYSPVARPTDAVRRRTWMRERRVLKGQPWIQCVAATSVGSSTASEDSRDFLPRCVGVGSTSVWILSDTFEIFVRTGRLNDESLHCAAWQSVRAPPLGTQLLPSNSAGSGPKSNILEGFFGAISVGPTAQVWLISPSGEVFFRKNTSPSNTVGTRWQPVKGMLLRHVCVGDNLVWGISAKGDVVFRRDVSAYKPQGRAWEVLERPSSGRCQYVTISPKPEIVRAINESGVVFNRQGVCEKNPTGACWIPVDFGFRVLAHVVTGSGQIGAIANMQPYVRGGWFSNICSQIAARDCEERKSRQFTQYHKYNDVSQIAKNKNGTLKWLRNGTWSDVLFILNAETLSYDDTLSYVVREESDFTITSPKPSSADAPSKEKLAITDLLGIQGSFQIESDPSPLRFQLEFVTRTLLLAAESERDKEAWIMSLLTTHAAAEGQKSREKVAVSLGFSPPEVTAIWALDGDGAPWYCCRPSLDDKGGHFLIWYSVKSYLLNETWGCALGRFVDITTTGGIAWALGENGKIYLSNHAKFVRSPAERYMVIRRRLVDGWTEIDNRLDDGTEVGNIVSVSLGRGCAWAISKKGALLIRAGVSREHPGGMRWEPIDQEYCITSVRVCGPNVWGFMEPDNVVLRRGFSGCYPFGTHWELSNGLVLSPFHLEGSPSIDDNPTDGYAVPPERPPCEITALDVAGSSKRRYIIDKAQRVLRGDEVRHGVIEWTEEWSGAIQVCEGDGGLLWALSADGDIKIKSAGLVSNWNSLQSVSAYEPTRTLKWSRIGPSDDSTSLPVTSTNRRGDGHIIVQDQSRWGEIYSRMLQARNVAVSDFVAASNALWQPFIREPMIGSKAIAYYPADDYWYHGRCVSGKKFENKYCFLVGFRNAVHIWTSSENMVYDEPPSSGMLYEGLDVLVSTPTPEGGERYSKGCVNETLPNDVYIVRVLRDDRATSEVPLAKIRLLPRREPPTFGEKWMKRISLATKINQSKFADPSGL